MIIKSDSIKVFHSTIRFDGLLQQMKFFFLILSKESKSVKEPPVCAQQENQGKFYISTSFLFGIKNHTGLDVILWVTRVQEGRM